MRHPRSEFALAIVDYKTSTDRDYDYDLQLQVYANAGTRDGLIVRGAYVHDLERADSVAVDISEAAVRSLRPEW